MSQPFVRGFLTIVRDVEVVTLKQKLYSLQLDDMETPVSLFVALTHQHGLIKLYGRTDTCVSSGFCRHS